MGLGLPPVEVLLSWPAPNYENPVRRGPEIYVLSSLFLGLSTVAVFFRLYARIFIRRWIGVDDVFILLAWVSTVGVTASVIYGNIAAGWDRHVWDNQLPTLMKGAKTLTFAAIFWASSASFVRISILCFYYRLTEHMHLRRYRWILHCVCVFSAMFMVAWILTLIFMCIPVGAFWSWPTPPETKCIRPGLFIFIMTIINTIIEFVLAILPLPVVLSLRFSPQQRWSVAGVFSLGFLVFIVGCVRCYYVHIGLMVTWDTTWWTEPQWITSEVENNLALICACAPALRPIIGRLLSRKSLHPSIQRRPKNSSSSTSQTQSPLHSQTHHFGALHTKEKMSYPPGSTCVWFDLEGIATDGMGYTVTITADAPRKRRRKSKLQRLSTLHSRDPDPDDEVGIVATRSVEVRQSVHERDETQEIHVFKPISEKDYEWIDETFTGLNDSKLSQFQSSSGRSDQGTEDIEMSAQGDGDTPFYSPASSETAPSIPQRTYRGLDRVSWLTPPGSRSGRRNSIANPVNSLR